VAQRSLPAPVAAPRRLAGRILPRTAAGFGWLCAGLVLAMWLNIASGAFVRLTNSGLGCPDWPTCTGHPVPPASYHAVIEFSNRLIAGFAIVMALTAYVAARRLQRPLQRRLALAVALVTLGQAPLGALTVHFHLNPYLVMSHFLVAVVALGLATWLWADAWPWRTADRAATPSLVRSLAAGATALGFALVASGTLSTAAGPHPGGLDVRRLGDWWTVTHWHVVVASAFALVCLPLLVLVARGRSWRPGGAGALTAALFLLLPAQAFVGEYQRMHGLPSGVVLVHVAIAGAAWLCLVALAARLLREPAKHTGLPA
jgi:heme a synthase